MQDIINRYFTSHCRSVLKKAERLAEEEGQKKVELVDILVAITNEKGSVGSSFISRIIKKKRKKTAKKKGLVAFSKESQKVIFESLKLAQFFQFPYVGTEHLLYALLKNQDKETTLALDQKKVNVEEALKQLEKILTKAADLSKDPLIIIPEKKKPTKGKKGDKKVQPEKGLEKEKEGKQEVIQEIMAEIGDLIQTFMEKKEEDDQAGLNKHLMRPSFGLINTENNPKPKKKFLDYFAKDLNSEVLGGKNDPVVGRDKEIDSLVRILMRKNKNNPVLVGEPGVGKTAVVSGLAQKIIKREVPEMLIGKRIMSLDMGLLIAGTSFRGEFEDRFRRVLDEAENDPNIILFIDELHNIIGTGSSQGSLDAANILKPALAKGQIRCIGATTVEEYHKYIERDGALERRFQPIWVKEGSLKETEKILKGLRAFFEEYHQVKISDQAILKVVELANKFITDRFFPDKAVDLLDETASFVVQDEHQKGASREFQKLLSEKEKLLFKKEEMVKNNDFDVAYSLLKEERKLDDLISKTNQKVQEERKFIPVVSESDVAEVLSLRIDIPRELIMESLGERLKKIEKILKESVKGQNEAILKISSNLKRNFSGISDPERPSTAFLLVGPTGVGKTYVAKILAKELFLRSDSLIRIDMSEFSEKHTVSRLVGSPPGYVGHGEKNYFSDRVRKNPYSLILFDEIEKAHPEIFNILLQILEDGILTDSLGRKVNFKNTLIIFTSNLGNDEFLKRVMGFSGKEEKKEGVSKIKKKKIRSKLEEFLRPELLNRLTDVVYFNPLTREAMEEIAKQELQKLADRILQRKASKLKISEELIKYLAKKSLDKKEGVRLLRKLIQRKIEEPIAQMILDGKIEEKSLIEVNYLKSQKNPVSIKVRTENKKEINKFFSPSSKEKKALLWQKIKKKSGIVSEN